MIKIFLIIVLLNIPCKPQAVEISAVSHSIISGLTIHYQMQDRNAYAKGDPIYREYQKKWRLLLPLEYLSAVNVGFAIAIENKNKITWLRIVTDAAVAGMIRVNVRQWTYQIAGGRNMFNQPNSTNTYFSRIEKFADAFVKVLALGIVLSFKYFLLPLIE